MNERQKAGVRLTPVFWLGAGLVAAGWLFPFEMLVSDYLPAHAGHLARIPGFVVFFDDLRGLVYGITSIGTLKGLIRWLVDVLGAFEPALFLGYAVWRIRANGDRVHAITMELSLLIGVIAMIISKIILTVDTNPQMCYGVWAAGILLGVGSFHANRWQGAAVNVDEEKKDRGSHKEVFFGFVVLSVISFGGIDRIYASIRSRWEHSVSWNIPMNSTLWPDATFGFIYGIELFLIWRYLLRCRFPGSGIQRMGWGALAGAIAGLLRAAQNREISAETMATVGSAFQLQATGPVTYAVVLGSIGALQALWIFKAEEKISSIEF